MMVEEDKGQCLLFFLSAFQCSYQITLMKPWVWRIRFILDLCWVSWKREIFMESSVADTVLLFYRWCLTVNKISRMRFMSNKAELNQVWTGKYLLFRRLSFFLLGLRKGSRRQRFPFGLCYLVHNGAICLAFRDDICWETKTKARFWMPVILICL